MARSDRHPSDPRLVFQGRHRERGEKRFVYTYSDIARAAGVTKKTVQNDASRGLVRPADLASVIAYVTRKAGRKRKSSA